MRLGRWKRVAVACAMTAWAADPAQAEWLKATSRHFQIYSDTTPDQIRRLATRLEQVDGALRLISKKEDTAESAANPVTVYVLGTETDVQRLVGGRNVAGAYYGRASGAVAFTPRRGGDGNLDPQLVLFHEYAHHYLLAQSAMAFPAWLSEGYAEFVSTAHFGDDGIRIGVPAQHRAYSLLEARKLPITTLFAPSGRLDAAQTEQLYGRGWLLTHYLLFDPARRGQLSIYLNALATGESPLKAAEKAFGDLRQLDRELQRYLTGRFKSALIGSGELPKVTVDVQPLTPGARALIEQRMISTRGVDTKTAAAIFASGSRAATPFPGDAVAQGWLAEMAFDAGDLAASEAAADRALAVDPKSAQALLYKGQVRLRRAANAKLPAADKTWGEARSWIIKANRLDPDSAAPLELFYDSFGMAHATPSKSAVVGLLRAQELAPQDDGLRFRAARQLLIDGEADDAKRVLRPLAFSPHAPPNNPAARLLAMLDKGASGPVAVTVLDAEAALDREKAGTD